MGPKNLKLKAPRSATTAASEANRWMLDPLDHGHEETELVLTLREIVRVTLVATEVGARFQREGIGTDPMAWMLAPRRAFNGIPPIEACIAQSDCARAVLIHGLGLDLDIGSDALDALMSDDVAEDEQHLEPIL